MRLDHVRAETPSTKAMADIVRPSTLYDAYLFDLDGTIYLGDEVLPGAIDTITTLREAGKVVRFLSNNPTKTPSQYSDKLTRMGIPTEVEEITNTIVTTLWWLQTYHPDAVVYPIAEAPLCQALEEAGFEISDDPSRIDVVISSYDRGFVYSKLQIAFDALWYHKRAILIETNPDRYCPFPGGRGQPDAAAITAAIEASTQVKCTASMGKPSELMVQAGLSGLDLPVENCIMVGDRLATDIRMALNLGMPAAVVFTGETKPVDVGQEYETVYRLNKISELLP